jgi:hypothetical protein
MVIKNSAEKQKSIKRKASIRNARGYPQTRRMMQIDFAISSQQTVKFEVYLFLHDPRLPFIENHLGGRVDELGNCDLRPLIFRF